MKKLSLTHWILIGGIIFFSGCIVYYSRKYKDTLAKIKENEDLLGSKPVVAEKREMAQDAADAIAFEVDAEQLKEESQRQIAGTIKKSDKKIIELNEKGYKFVAKVVPQTLIATKSSNFIPATAVYQGGVVHQIKDYKYSDGIVG